MHDQVALGVHGYPLPLVDRVADHHLASLGSKGISVVSLYMSAAHRDHPEAWAGRLANRLAARSVRLFCLVGPAGRLLAVSDDERRQAVRDVARGIEAVRLAGGERLFIQPGGFHPSGPWWFDPANFSVAARVAVTRSLRDLASRAEAAGVGLVIEGYQGSVFESPMVMREIIEEVGSPVVGANLDYVNFMTPAAVARWPRSLDDMVASLGPALVSVHVKDCRVQPRLTCQIDERVAGAGVLDLRPVVSVGRKMGVPLLIEHLAPRNATASIEHMVSIVD